jgi:GH15 family glucan-1,4-alpha-glucosidase
MAGHEEAGPNPWIITTLWYAEFLIASAEKTEDLAPALNILNWAIDQALPSGVLAEQFDRATGRPCSVSPLTWSHSTFIAVVNSYLAKQQELDPAIHSISIRQ